MKLQKPVQIRPDFLYCDFRDFIFYFFKLTLVPDFGSASVGLAMRNGSKNKDASHLIYRVPTAVLPW